MKSDSVKNIHEFFIVSNDVPVKFYYSFIDSVTKKYSHLSKEVMAEYVLVRNNPWLIDSLRNLDYYTQNLKGKFQYNQPEEIVFHQGDTVQIPNRSEADSLISCMRATAIDVNIPEYKLRIIQNTDTLIEFKVRVGRNAEEYLEAVGRVVNQRTPIGKGEIISALRKPVFYNLHTGEKYEETRRDDGRYTLMPVVPSLEPIINGTKYGTMFHSTTNLKTLGKPYSNGCIGLREADMWTLYYYAPPGTPINIRYDLKPAGKQSGEFKDIYHLKDSLNRLAL